MGPILPNVMFAYEFMKNDELLQHCALLYVYEHDFCDRSPHLSHCAVRALVVARF